MIKLLFAIIGILVGVIVGLVLPITYSPTYALYISVAILACLDSVFGGVRANLENTFDTRNIYIRFLEMRYWLLF